MDTDLFGNAPTRKVKYKANGYAARPGSGPKLECCKTCKHKHSNEMRSGKVHWKCQLRGKDWTNSYGTDIRMSSPACSRWIPLMQPLYCKARPCTVSCHYYKLAQCPDHLRKAVLFAAQSKEVANAM